MTASPVPGVTLKTTKANNIHMRYAEIGSGPLVLFCHGWPESWYSWRHQLHGGERRGLPLRGARHARLWRHRGARADRPVHAPHLVGDMAELVKALGETKAVIVGHDWGAPVAWHAALWRPDLFTAVCAMSVPYAPPGYVDILSALEKLGINDFYLQYFQKPGVPEAELQQDIRERPAPHLLHRRRRARRKRARASRRLTARHPARQHRRSRDAAGLAERGRPRLLHAGIRAHRLSRRPELVPQPPAQLGAGRPVARPADPPALAVHRRQPRRRAALPRRPVASSTPTRRPCPACAAATSSRAPATGCSRSSRRGQQTADRLPERPVIYCRHH